MLVRLLAPAQSMLFAPLLVAASLGILFGPADIPARAPLRVFGAASLKDALDDANVRYQRGTGRRVVTSYDGSGILAQQIYYGAPADIFISADIDWMDYLADRNLIKHETRLNLLGNKLVLIASAGSAPTLAIGTNFPLAQALGNGRLAMADPKAVPAGKYGRAALESLGIWPAVETRVAAAENVRAALALVSRGEAPLGIVYQTDAAADPHVRVVGVFPENTHPPIVYPVALIGTSTNGDAPGFLTFLRSVGVRPLWTRQGFTVLK